MKAFSARASVLGLTVLLAACASSGTGGRDAAQVTRFHLGQPIARGQIAVEPVDAEAAQTLEFRTYAAAVGRELQRLGWTVADGVTTSEQVALIDVNRGTRAALRRSSPVTVGIGGGTGGYGSGVGLGASFGLGGGGSRDEVVTELTVSIKRRSDGSVFWEGRAQAAAREDQPGADPAIAVDRLARALFQDFPGESGRTINVR